MSAFPRLQRMLLAFLVTMALLAAPGVHSAAAQVQLPW
jgi:hypothetical protein